MSECLIEPYDPDYTLGHLAMDQTHAEFIELVNRLGRADRQRFIDLFGELVRHTEAHFDAEDALMIDSSFPALYEHRDEHARVRGEMQHFATMIERGSTIMARSWVRERLPDWLDLHARTMDSALAAHLKKQTLNPVTV